jgi:hypothetical protein
VPGGLGNLDYARNVFRAACTSSRIGWEEAGKGMGAKIAACSLALLASLSLVRQACPQANLTYQNRGAYSEGIRTAPSTGPGLDLIAAVVDYREPYANLPQSFRALFYLPSSDPVYLTLREIDTRYFYWLDNVRQPGWQAGRSNLFEWATATVIRSLNWKQKPLGLDDLGATARLGRSTPGKLEVVAPVALYHSRPPQSAESYRFVFLPSERMRLEFKVFAEAKSTPLDRQLFPTVLSRQPHTVIWTAGSAPDGWYRLLIDGYALSNNARVDGVVRFYHSRRLGN